MPFVEGEIAARPAPARAAAPGRGRAPDRARGGAGARVRPPARRRPPRHQAREHPAHPGRHRRWWPTSGSRARWAATTQLTQTGHGHRHAGLHEPGAGERATRRSTPGPTSTRSAACCTRCWPASRRSPGPTAQAIIAKRLTRAACRACGAVAARRAGGRGPGDPAGAGAGRRPTGSPRRREFARALQTPEPPRHRRRSPPRRRRPRLPPTATDRGAPAPPAARRSRSRSLLGFLLGLGVLFALAPLARRGRPTTAGPSVLAVLPFENLGDSADAYFADGVTDEVRGKLVAARRASR